MFYKNYYSIVIFELLLLYKLMLTQTERWLTESVVHWRKCLNVYDYVYLCLESNLVFINT